jgi:hypothetical protein
LPIIYGLAERQKEENIRYTSFFIPLLPRICRVLNVNYERESRVKSCRLMNIPDLPFAK